MSSFVLKIFAIISMLIDHASFAFYGKFSPWNYLGRLAFPIFAFQISQGFQHTSNPNKYALRLLLFALLSQIPFSLFLYTITGEFLTLNIFFTLLFGLFAIYAYEKCPSKWLGFFACILLAGLASLLHTDYGYYGVLLIFLFYVLRNHKIGMVFAFLGLTIVKFIPSFLQTNFYYPNILLCLFTSLAIVPILLYNGKQGKKSKYFFYVFYPCHLLLFAFLRIIFTT